MSLLRKVSYCYTLQENITCFQLSSLLICFILYPGFNPSASLTNNVAANANAGVQRAPAAYLSSSSSSSGPALFGHWGHSYPDTATGATGAAGAAGGAGGALQPYSGTAGAAGGALQPYSGVGAAGGAGAALQPYSRGNKSCGS